MINPKPHQPVFSSFSSKAEKLFFFLQNCFELVLTELKLHNEGTGAHSQFSVEQRKN
jgi:hypothetical protein